MAQQPIKAAWAEIEQTLHQTNAPLSLVKQFQQHYLRYRGGYTGTVDWTHVRAPENDDIVQIHTDVASSAEQQTALLATLVLIKVNGGLGTSMQLDRAKSLIPARSGQSFLQIIAKQVNAWRNRCGVALPLIFMNSFRTRDDTLASISSHHSPADIPFDFLQHQVPRIDHSTGCPVKLSSFEETWAPPGHGDIYLALHENGLLERLLKAGYRWAMVSNSDNLSATVEPSILRHLDKNGVDFAMEVTSKAPADIKGGTLIRYHDRLSLLERSQVDPQHIDQFEDMDRFRIFNTNTLWWNIETLRDLLVAGQFDLPLIINRKRVEDIDIVQLETAMGAAISSFKHAKGLHVPRSRFAPVKTTNDLLALRSNAYVDDETYGVRLNPNRSAEVPPLVHLDPSYYSALDGFEKRFPHPLDLSDCTRLHVKGDVSFGKNVSVRGWARLHNESGIPQMIPDGRRIVDQVISWS